MVNMDYKGNIKKYLSTTLGWKVNFDEIGSLIDKISFGFVGGADYSLINVDGFNGVAIKPLGEIGFAAVKRMAITVGRNLGLIPVLILERMDSHQRQSMIKDRINFIVPGKQIYLPAIGIWLSERGLGQPAIKNDMLAPLATAVIVYVLARNITDEMTVSELAERMGYSVKSISLAAAELNRHELISIRQEGRKKYLRFMSPLKMLWKKAYSLAPNLVEKRMFGNDIMKVGAVCQKASDTALSEESMLAPPHQDIFAVYSRNPQLKTLDLNPTEGSVVVEVWKINPALTAKDGIVDPFSLALSYKGDDDPRVGIELSNLIEKSLIDNA